MRRKPMMMPTTMRRHDSGKMFGNLGVMWNPEKKKKQIGHRTTLNNVVWDSFISSGLASARTKALKLSYDR